MGTTVLINSFSSFPGGGGGGPVAINQDTRVNHLNQGNLTTHSLAITLGASADLLLVKIGWRDTAAVSSVREVNGSGALMTQIGTLSEANSNFKCDMYYLVGPTTGSSAAHIVMSADARISVELCSLVGVDQASPIAAQDQAIENSSTTIATPGALSPVGVGGWIETVLESSTNSEPTPDSGALTFYSENGIIGAGYAGSRELNVGSSVTPGWSGLDGSSISTMKAVLFKAAVSS